MAKMVCPYLGIRFKAVTQHFLAWVNLSYQPISRNYLPHNGILEIMFPKFTGVNYLPHIGILDSAPPTPEAASETTTPLSLINIKPTFNMKDFL